MLLIPGPPASQNTGSAESPVVERIRTIGNAIKREPASAGFSRTISVPQSATFGPESVRAVHRVSVRSSALAPSGTVRAVVGPLHAPREKAMKVRAKRRVVPWCGISAYGELASSLALDISGRAKRGPLHAVVTPVLMQGRTETVRGKQ